MYNLAEPKSIEATPTYMTWYSILYELSILKGFTTWIIFFKAYKITLVLSLHAPVVYKR